MSKTQLKQIVCLLKEAQMDLAWMCYIQSFVSTKNTRLQDAKKNF